jgi:hypothetical protein
VRASSAFEVEMAIEELKRHKSANIDKFQLNLMNAGGKVIRSEIHRLINSIWNKESIIVPIYEKGRLVIIEAYSYVQNSIPHPLGKAKSICRGSMDFDITG